MNQNWDAVKQEYITTDISLRCLAEKYGVGFTSIFSRSKRENWVSLREEYKAKVDSKAMQKAVQAGAKEKFNAIKMMQDELIPGLYKATQQATQDLSKLLVGGEIIEGTPVKARDVQALRQAVKTLQELVGYYPNQDDEDDSTGLIEIAPILPQEEVVDAEE